MNDPIERIREALAAGPRAGEWRVSKHTDNRNALIYDAEGFEVGRVCYPNRDANAELIAACSPDAIRTLLDRLDAAERENERLNAELDLYRMQRRTVTIDDKTPPTL